MQAMKRDQARHIVWVTTALVVLLVTGGLVGMLGLLSPQVDRMDERLLLPDALLACSGRLYYRLVHTTQPLQCFRGVTLDALAQGITILCLREEMRERFDAPDCTGPEVSTH
jgi:hypothetical protein